MMKPAYAFWLILAALTFIAIQSFVSLPGAIVTIVEIALDVIAMFASFSNSMSNKHRVLLFITGLGLVLPHVVNGVQTVAGRPLLTNDIWTALLMLRSSLVGLALIVFGLNATAKMWHRLVIAAIGFAWTGFITLGPQALTDPRQLVYLLLMVLVVGLSYWANAYLKEGKPVDR